MIEKFLTEVLFFLVLVNPVSKIFILHILSKNTGKNDMRKVMIKSSFVALIILISFCFAGTFILQDVFHISVESLQVAGGLVLVSVGYTALKKGVFFEVDTDQKLADMAIVPIASPIIAGPATMTASIVESSVYGPWFVSAALFTALVINFSIMYFSKSITDTLNRFNVSGALIRITGLFIASIGMEMILRGIKNFFGIP
ncbi:MAG: MarC family protein [Candidatus Aenigmarchaeota archaeon]|nr:MarC family protein [Candidatus Aenigmarchaeota archaeon]